MADVTMPDEMVDWMKARDWGDHHLEWHVVRQWDIRVELSNQGHELSRRLIEFARSRGWRRAPLQEGERGNGLEFLLMHRAMLQLLREEFPERLALLVGWDSPPQDPNDPKAPVASGERFELLMTEAVIRIETAGHSFADEEDFALFLQTRLRPGPGDPFRRSTDPRAGLHNYLHNRWSDPTSEINLGDPTVNLYNRRFWELHGWIDLQWGRFREARGLSDTDPAYASDLQSHREMMKHPLRHHHLLAAGGEGAIDAPRPRVPSLFIE